MTETDGASDVLRAIVGAAEKSAIERERLTPRSALEKLQEVLGA